ncbi:hypothetical protein [Priestia megaterium]|uniref:hypothetical protein n=1 Tax=Priestia megaterium TaxID=1404 RepID=UPI0018A29B8D|nr:hypothetical protein [Priestia megaterium]
MSTPSKNIRIILPLKWLLLTITVSSFLVVPSIQGTTPAYLLCFMSLIFVGFMNKHIAETFYKDVVIYFFIFISLIMLSQYFLALSQRDIRPEPGLIFIDGVSTVTLFRTSMITQSMYMFVALIFFTLTKHYYNEHWDKYFMRGATFLALYGVYEFVYFLIFKDSGDFISNRVFGDDPERIGSAFQITHIGPLALQRIKSLTGEPSMFSLTIVPFFFYAYFQKRYKLASLFAFTTIFSFSTTAYIGMAIFLIFLFSEFTKNLKFVYFFTLTLLVSIMIVGLDKIWEIIYAAVFEKLLSNSVSTTDRLYYMTNHLHYFTELPFFNKIFGIGFGYIRSTDFFSTIVVNSGILGFILITIIFLYPIFKIKINNDPRNTATKLSLLFIYISLMISVPEFSYLSIWLFVGIAYNTIRAQRRQNKKFVDKEIKTAS